MSNQFDILPDMRSFYDNIVKDERAKNYIAGKNTIFWNYINLVMYNYKIIDKDDNLVRPHFALNYLVPKLINHSVTSYNLLLHNMQEECLIMIRQSFEVVWLLKYFIEYPEKEIEWVKRSFPDQEGKKPKGMNPFEVREGFPEESDVMDYIYSNLSNFVHSNFVASTNGMHIGGQYDEWFIDLSMQKIVISVHEMLDVLYRILESDKNKYIISNEDDFYVINKDIVKDKDLEHVLVNSIELYKKTVLGLWELQITKDYEQEALEKLIAKGYLKVR